MKNLLLSLLVVLPLTSCLLPEDEVAIAEATEQRAEQVVEAQELWARQEIDDDELWRRINSANMQHARTVKQILTSGQTVSTFGDLIKNPASVLPALVGSVAAAFYARKRVPKVVSEQRDKARAERGEPVTSAEAELRREELVNEVVRRLNA